MSFEEDFSKSYEYIDWSTNTEVAQIDGKEIVCLRSSFGLLRPTLIALEAMAREIEFDRNSVGFEIKTSVRGKPIVVPKANTKTMRYFYQLKTFFKHYGGLERYVFSPHVSAVGEALTELLVNPYDFSFREPDSIERSTGKTHGEVFNDVVAKVANIVASREFRERMRLRMRNAARNEAKGLAIEQKVFENKSRQLVLMLHFGYLEPHRRTITPEQIQKHRQKFFNNCRTNKLLRGIVDYIWKLEEGDESGLHLHMLIFYTAEACRDVLIAKLIGDYWVKATGIGQYWNSNANKAFHEKHGHGVGTGEINWDDDQKREALRINIRYMTKADQFLKLKYGARIHLFGTSQVEEKKKPGRPRVVKAKLDADTTGDDTSDEIRVDSIDATLPYETGDEQGD